MVEQLISARFFPKIWDAFATIAHDSGVTLQGSAYRAVREHPLQDIEGALSQLRPDEFQTFCIGEHDEMDAIAARGPALAQAHELLEEFWEHIC
jgi:hypothetical protein